MIIFAFDHQSLEPSVKTVMLREWRCLYIWNWCNWRYWQLESLSQLDIHLELFLFAFQGLKLHEFFVLTKFAMFFVDDFESAISTNQNKLTQLIWRINRVTRIIQKLQLFWQLFMHELESNHAYFVFIMQNNASLKCWNFILTQTAKI